VDKSPYSAWVICERVIIVIIKETSSSSCRRFHGRTTAIRLLAAVMVLTGLLAAGVGTATAWSAPPSGEFACVVDDAGFHVGLAWTVTSWNPGEPSGENPSIQVEMSRDGGAWESLAVGAFTPDNGGQFGGTTIVSEGPGSLTLRAYATAPWGDGTVDGTKLSVDLSVPTLEDIGDPRCLVQPTPIPTPTPEPAAPADVKSETEEATPVPDVTVAPPKPAAEAAPEVLGKELARTGAESTDLALLALVFITLGTATYGTGQIVSRLARRH
jgi:hypothetical protein